MDEENQTPAGISRITVQGFKSLAAESTIEIGNLTLLAGANSSGKSSIMQPLLMLKQTLENSYDPGPLLLNGPHVRFTSVNQLITKSSLQKRNNNFTTTIELSKKESLKLTFQPNPDGGIELIEMNIIWGEKITTLRPDMTIAEIKEILDKKQNNISNPQIKRIKCLLFIGSSYDSNPTILFLNEPIVFQAFIQQVIHIPGLRGNPERSYNTTAVGDFFTGTFEPYVASVIHHWEKIQSPNLNNLLLALQNLGLSQNIKTNRLNDTLVELKVSRLPYKYQEENDDLVNIADVGFGVSQTLPVIVALLTAEPGQLVYLEQPEIHLHPRAQVALAQILADAAKRGVKVVAETHSSLLLLGVQTLIAEGKLDHELVRLHWFTRGEDGTTTISSVIPDETGAFGDWPEDFADVELDAQSRYMDAVEAHWSQKKR